MEGQLAVAGMVSPEWVAKYLTGVKMVTWCLEEVHCGAAELIGLQCQDREFIHRVVDCLGSTYDTLDWCQCWLPLRSYSPPEQQWWNRVLPNP